MVDYNKLTVVEIRAEFKYRGVSAAGLTRKQQLIERLLQLDAENAQTEQRAAESTTIEAPSPKEPAVLEPQDEKAQLATAPPDTQPHIAAPSQENGPLVQEKTTSSVTEDQPPLSGPAATSPEISSQPTTPPSVESPALSAASSAGGEESRKRKRRSATPPLSSQDAHMKRQKQEEAGVIVHLKEDGEPAATSVELAVPETEPEVEEKADSAPVSESTNPSVSNVRLNNAKEHPKNEIPIPSTEAQDATTSFIARAHGSLKNEAVEISAIKPTESEPKVQSGKDKRYKNLFVPTSTSVPPINLDGTSEDPHNTERDVAPALHAATPALYIRDFMRPLQPNNLKDHLISLAQPPHSPESVPNQNILVDFHLDTIRTHCFASFSSVSAAARVRSALHDRVWPNERTRKPLWADFVPEEKVQSWVDMETSAGGSRGSSAKRWEVVYEQSEDGSGTIASMREVGAVSGGPPTGPRQPVTAPVVLPPNLPTPEVHRERMLDAPDVKGSAAASQTQTQQPKPSASSFVALDILFKSTTAKPKLYYSPVEKERAERRLEELNSKSSRAGGDGDRTGVDMRRFTFEEGDRLVDNGPEFGLRRGGGAGPGEGRAGGGGFDGKRERNGARYRGVGGAGNGRRGGGGWRGR